MFNRIPFILIHNDDDETKDHNGWSVFLSGSIKAVDTFNSFKNEKSFLKASNRIVHCVKCVLFYLPTLHIWAIKCKCWKVTHVLISHTFQLLCKMTKMKLFWKDGDIIVSWNVFLIQFIFQQKKHKMLRNHYQFNCLFNKTNFTLMSVMSMNLWN